MILKLLLPKYFIKLIVSKKGTMNTVKVEVQTLAKVERSNPKLLAQLKGKIKYTIGLSMDIELVEKNSIPRSQGGKINIVLNNR